MSTAFDYHRLKNWEFPVIEQHYTHKDSILYALGAGYATDLSDPRVLRYLYEEELKAVPTMAVVLGYPGFWFKNPETGVDWVKVVHGEQNVHIHQPLPSEGTILGHSRVVSITDKGAGKGVLVAFETKISNKHTNELLATVSQVAFCRGEGGYSANGQPSDTVESTPVLYPDRAPDVVSDFQTREEMALIYRLSGDMNPLHADPAVAKSAGFDKPILHGLASFAVAGHAILKSCCDYNSDRLEIMNARFTSPVFPGETIRTKIWKQQDNELIFQSSVVERDAIVLNNGVVKLRS